jgi:hypothetical protein
MTRLAAERPRMTEQPHKLPPAHCPRCGYDLRGTAYAWQDACPLEGVCPDCGHNFAWRNIFRHRQHALLLEHQWRRRPVSSGLWTLAMTLRPRRFWQSLRLEHDVSLAIVALVILGAALFLGAFTWAATVSSALFDWVTVGVAQSSPGDLLAAAWRATQRAADRLVTYRLSVLAAPFLVPLCFPLLFLTLPASHIRFVHLLRIAWYSLAGLCMLTAAMTYGLALLDVARDLRLLPDATKEVTHLLIRVGAPWSPGFLQRIRGLSTTAAALDFLVVWPLLAWWWYCACRWYLKLARPAAVAVLLTLLASLASLIVQLVLVDGWLRYWG